MYIINNRGGGGGRSRNIGRLGRLGTAPIDLWRPMFADDIRVDSRYCSDSTLRDVVGSGCLLVKVLQVYVSRCTPKFARSETSLSLVFRIRISRAPRLFNALIIFCFYFIILVSFEWP